jgi:hypothetical protein
MHNTVDEFWSDFMSLAYKEAGGADFIFRGITDEGHELIPSIGRNTKDNTKGDISSLEDALLSGFKRLTAPIVQPAPSYDWEWLFLAQHYGLPTRILDWSTNPFVALFFAAERDDVKNGAVNYLQHAVTDQYELFDHTLANYVKSEQKKWFHLFRIQPKQGNVIFVRPKYTDTRYLH